ncbi:MAG: hypothetical protein M3O20_10865 [Acidobacteriota bacterium]|nr:hypothetical protein [Acidobacteriota bacterium]
MKSSLKTVSLCLLLAAALGWAQSQAPAQAPAQAPSPAAGQTPNPAPGVPSASEPTASTPSATLRPPEVSSTVNTGTGLSIEADYWLTRGSAPLVRGGAGDTTGVPGAFQFLSKPKSAIGVRVNIPVSKNGTLRGSYFQDQSTGGSVASQDLNLFEQSIASGDLLATRYRIQAFKLSFDYLTYFWKHGGSEIRLKTLYEIQRISVTNEIDDFQTDSSGDLVNINPAAGTKSFFFPTFGLGIEHTLSPHFRWEARASGFALPHKQVLGDMEADIAFRIKHFELLAGGRYLHYKTNPKADQYDIGSLWGPYVGLRYYWKKQ